MHISLKTYFRMLFNIVAIFSTLFGVIFVFVDFPESCNKLLLLSILVLFMFLVSFIICYVKSKSCQIVISKKTVLNIFFGDLFKMNGNIVIPVSEYFDMVVDEKYVSSKTLHGMFVKKIFSNNVMNLEQLITNNLKERGIEGIYDKKRKKFKYPVGTTAIIRIGDINYFLFVLTKFNRNNKAYCNIEDYYTALQRLLKNLNDFSQGQPIYMPLIGGGLSNVNMSKTDLIHSIILSIKSNRHFEAIAGINLILTDNIKNEVDLFDIQYCHK